MPPGSKSRPLVAHVEDADDDSGSSINGKPGTRKYATFGAPVNSSKANVSKSRADKRPTVSRSSPGTVTFNEADSRRSSDQKGKATLRRSPEKSCSDPEPRHWDRERQRRDRKLREHEQDERAAAAHVVNADAAKDESRTLRARRPAAPKQSVSHPAPNPIYRRGHVDTPASYSMQQQPAMSASRPRAQTRPASYYADQPSRNPMGMMWHSSQPPHSPTAPFSVGAFPPPPMWQAPPASPLGFAPAPPPPSPGGPAAHGFSDGLAGQNPHYHLKQRFEPRPSSALGYRNPYPPPPPSSIGDYHDHGDYLNDQHYAPSVTRRPSGMRRSSLSQRADDDRRRMPPPPPVPPRPQSAAPPPTSYRPPSLQQRPPSHRGQSRPPAPQRRSVNFADRPESEDDDFSADDELFHDTSPGESLDGQHALVNRSRRSSTAYDHRDYDVLPASNRPRRASTYDSNSNPLASGGVSLEEKKYNDALNYQAAVGGSSQVPLTAETLRKAGAASSRSTRSSGSRDDSDYKRSNATGYTRSTLNSDDWSIKVTGDARVRLPGAEIECGEGTEIVFSGPGGGGFRSGSDMASMVHPQLEDSRSRVGRKALPHRPRPSSQSDSQSRGYAPSNASYEYY